jgi:hypothetical protein
MRGVSVALLLSLLLSSLLVVVINAPTVSAWVPTQNTWIADSDGLASNGNNWENGSLFMDQIVWFTGDHVANCTWDFVSVQMAWGWNINRFAEIRFVDNYTGSVQVTTYIYIYQGIIPFPIGPGPDPHYPGPLDWLTMSQGTLLLLVVFGGGLVFLLILAILSKRR